MNVQMKITFLLAITAAIVSTMAAPPMKDQTLPEIEGRQRETNVGVGVPFIFGMDLNRQRNTSSVGNSSETAMDLGVLGGLVRVVLDRTRDANGNRRGPIGVWIFGQKVSGRR